VIGVVIGVATGVVAGVVPLLEAAGTGVEVFKIPMVLDVNTAVLVVTAVDDEVELLFEAAGAGVGVLVALVLLFEAAGASAGVPEGMGVEVLVSMSAVVEVLATPVVLDDGTATVLELVAANADVVLLLLLVPISAGVSSHDASTPPTSTSTGWDEGKGSSSWSRNITSRIAKESASVCKPRSSNIKIRRETDNPAKG